MTDYGIPTLTSLLTPEEVATLVALGKRQAYADGEIIHEQDDAVSAMDIIVSGQVKVIKRRPNGNVVMEATLKPGQLYGDIATLFQTRRSHGTIALGETVIDHYPPAAFGKLLEHSGILRALYRLLCIRHSRSVELLDDLRMLPTEVRLAKLLAGMLPKADKVGRIACLQEDLANLMGVTSVTIAKAITTLKRAGLIETGYRQVTIADPSRLRKWLAEKDPQ